MRKKIMSGNKTVITSLSIIIVALFIGTAISPAYAVKSNSVSTSTIISEPAPSDSGVRVPLVNEPAVVSEPAVPSESTASETSAPSVDSSSASSSPSEVITSDTSSLSLSGSGDSSSGSLDIQTSSSVSSISSPSTLSTSTPGGDSSSGGLDSASASQVPSSTLTTGSTTTTQVPPTTSNGIVYFNVGSAGGSSSEGTPDVTVTTDSNGAALISLPSLISEVDASIVVNVDYAVVSGAVKEVPYFTAADEIDLIVIDEVRLRAKIAWLEFKEELKTFITKEILNPLRNLGNLAQGLISLGLIACNAFDISLKDIVNALGTGLAWLWSIPGVQELLAKVYENFKHFVDNLIENAKTLIKTAWENILKYLNTHTFRQILQDLEDLILIPLLKGAITLATIGAKIIEGCEKLIGQSDIKFMWKQQRDCNKFMVKTDNEAMLKFTIKSGGGAMFNNGQDSILVKVVKGSGSGSTADSGSYSQSSSSVASGSEPSSSLDSSQSSSSTPTMPSMS